MTFSLSHTSSSLVSICASLSLEYRVSSGRSLIQELDDGGSESDGGRETASSRERQSDDSDVPPLI